MGLKKDVNRAKIRLTEKVINIRKNSMATYLMVIIWLVGSLMCLLIAKRRKVKSTVLRNMIFCFFGPLAIPFAFFAKP